MRTDLTPDEMGVGPFYKLLTSVVVPRPIAWVSTRSADGVDNLAPHSFFTVSCVDPPMIQFTSVGKKDSLRNATETGEFVVCLANESMFEKINATATDFPSEISEFAEVGLTAEKSATVTPSRVLESPVALECTLHTALELGNSTVVIGRVTHAAIDDDVFVTDSHDNTLPDIGKLAPLARLGKNEWSRMGEIIEISRIPYDNWPGHFEKK
ncbi:flavin reductase (DIM6/NTAB) family NADH-FMN oxidoreductase RutF [Pseudonocardia sediminis]|uniref:Flavin reductase (DIM6/NTAB) family NADH-FMN oxidoreductase RutF n=1 Tax=Pseudonocardia sediminis TaxID=1397368 RepID=A0A4Q7UW45_PSEST|nr:flavin reductase family protein [Pseudonocardia sediminis]RZT85081.1 flavin reductase (DIM6/NTAB) family NADH-FMN oxidoreductase RutF [Pseudonocardia sediminis]